MDLLAIAIVLSTLLSLGFTVFMIKRGEKQTLRTLEGLGQQLDEGIQAINTQLEPIIKANSRAMGAISHLADDTKMDKALERRIGQDIIGQNDDILEGIKMAFPRVAEYVEEHPEAISKLLPRLNTLISDPEARKRLSLDFLDTKGDVSRIWREG